MNFRHLVVGMVAAVALAACAHLAPAPSFLQELSKQYAHLSQPDGSPHGYKWSKAKAEHFKGKSERAAAGVDVQPENPITWNVNREVRPELLNAYDMLQIALVPDQKKVTRPVPAAQAQAYFDCWVDQAHSKWVPTSRAADCRAGFYEAFCRMYSDKCQGAVVRDQVFRVHFDTDVSAVNAVGRQTVAKAAEAFTKGASEVIVAGHTDTVGNAAYNLELSKARAASVRAALVDHGVPAEKINAKYFGQHQPIVQTGDEVPNANNRRVLIVVR